MTRSVVAIGRTIKGADTFMGKGPMSTGRGGGLRQDFDLAAGLNAILAIGHDLLARLESVVDDCGGLVQGAELDGPLLHDMVAADHEGVWSVRTVLHRGHRDGDHVAADRDLSANVDELPRPQD